jgi:hypothetical protein
VIDWITNQEVDFCFFKALESKGNSMYLVKTNLTRRLLLVNLFNWSWEEVKGGAS